MTNRKELILTIGKVLRDYRVNLGLSQAELGGIIGVSFQQVQKYERGQNRLSLDGFLMIMEGIGGNPAEFIEKVISERGAEPTLINKQDSHIGRYVSLYRKMPPKVQKKVLALVKAISNDTGSIS